jgi:hypothetical protein
VRKAIDVDQHPFVKVLSNVIEPVEGCRGSFQCAARCTLRSRPVAPKVATSKLSRGVVKVIKSVSEPEPASHASASELARPQVRMFFVKWIFRR